MTVIVDMEPNSSRLEAALNRISLRFRGLEQEANRVNKSVDKLNTVKLDTSNAASELQKLNTSVTATAANIEQKFTSVSNNLQKAFAALTAIVAGGAITAGILQASDSMTVLENRIALVTGRNAELTKTKEQLFEIAKLSRGSLEGTVETFNRFGLALKDSNVSMNDLLKATTSVQQALAIVGGPSESANAAIFQLGQALSSGTLRGEELNSILEQAPRIARAISDELGVGIGALRGMAQEGKLTSDVVLKAMLNQASAINEEFKLVNGTIGQSKTVLKDSFTAALADFDRGFGMSAGIADNLSMISEAVDSVRPSMMTFGFNMRAAIINPVKDFITIAGGLGNILVAVFERISAAQYAVILPMRTFSDDVSVLFNYVLVGAVTDFINSLLGLRAVLLQYVDAGVAQAFYQIFNAKTVSDFRTGLDMLAESIRNMGYQWFNVLNFVERNIRQTNISLLKAGIYLGLIDQKLIRFRKPSFESFSKSAEVAAYYLRELFTVAIADPANDLWVAVAQIVVQKFARIIEGAANSYREFLRDVTGLNFDFGADSLIRLADSIRSVGNSFGSWVIIGMYDSFLSAVTVQLKNQVKYMLQQLNVIQMLKVTYKDFLSGVLDLPAQFSRNFPRMIADFRTNLVNNSGYILDNTIRNTIENFPYRSLADVYEAVATSLFTTISQSVSNVFKGLFEITGIEIFSKLSDSFKQISENAEQIRASLNNFNISGFYDLYSLLSSDRGVEEYFNRIKESIKSLSDGTLEEALKRVTTFVKSVERAFFWVYDKVVGNSWWPDLMQGIVENAKNELDKADRIVKQFTNSVESQFRRLYKSAPNNFADNLVNSVKNTFGMAIGYVLQGIGGFNSAISSVSTEAGRAIGLAVLTGFTRVLAPNQLTSIYNFLFASLIVDLTSRILDVAGKEIFDADIIGQMFAPLGDQLGKIVRESLLNLPAIISFIGQISSDFVDAFLENFGLIGEAIIDLKSLIPGSGLLDMLIFGGSISLLMGKFGAFTTGLNTALSILLGLSVGGVGVADGKNVGGLLGMLIFGSNARLIIGTLIGVAGVLGTLTGALNTFSPLVTMASSLGIMGLAIFGGPNFLTLVKTTLAKVGVLLTSFSKENKTASILESLLPKDTSVIKNWFANNMPNLTNFIKADQATKTSMASGFIDSILDPALFKERVAKMKDYLKNIKWNDLKSGKTANFATSIFGLLDATTFFKDLSSGFDKVKGKASNLSKLSSLFGETGFLGKVFFGKFGKIAILVAAILAVFATASNAATGLEQTASTLSSITEYGIIGLVLFGAMGHKGVRSIVLKTAKFAAETLFGTGGVLLNSSRFAKTNIMASILNIGQILPLNAAGKAGGFLGKFLLGTGSFLFGQLKNLVSMIGVVVGAVGGLATLGIAAAVGILGVWLFGPGDGLFDSFAKLWDMTIDWWTGTTKAARTARSEIEAMLKFDKVADIEINLKAQLEQVNFGAMSRDQVDSLRSALTAANKIYERNQSVFENEGKLTRSQIREVKLATNNVEASIQKLPGYNTEDAATISGAVNQNVYKGLVAANLTSAQEKGANRAYMNTGIYVYDEYIQKPLDNIARSLAIFGSSAGEGQPLKEDLVANRMASNQPIRMYDLNEAFKKYLPDVAKDLVEATNGNYFPVPSPGQPIDGGVRAMVEEFSPGTIQRAQEAAVALANKLAEATRGRNLANQEDLLTIQSIISSERIALDQAVARVKLAEAMVTGNEEYLSSLDGIAAKAASIGAEGIAGAVDLQGVPQVLVDDLAKSVKAYETRLLEVKKAVYEEFKKKTGENFSFEDFLGDNPDLANAFSVKDLLKAMPERGLTNAEAIQLFGLSEDVIKAAGNTSADNIVEALQERLLSGLDKFNKRISDVGINLQLDYFPEGETYALAERALYEAEQAVAKFNRTGSKVDFIDMQKTKIEAALALGDVEDKIRVLSEFGQINFPDLNKLLAIDQKNIDRIIAAGKAIAFLKLMVESMGERAAANSLNIPVGNIANAGEQIQAAIAAQNNIISSIIPDPVSTGTSDTKSGAAKTWWEGFKEALSSMDLSLEDSFLASISQQTVASLLTASEKYKAAQEAINKSAADEVSIRQKNLKIMQEIRRQAVSSLADGTFGGASTMLENIGQSVDKNTLGLMNATDIAMAKSVALRIDQLTQERDLMAEGSQAQISATLEINRLTESLEKLTSRAQEVTDATNAVKDSFRDQFKSFLKGETTIKGVFEGVLDTFTNTIIDKFSQAFTNNLFDALGLDKIFDDLFSTMFSSMQSASMQSSMGSGFFGNIIAGIGGLSGNWLGGWATGGYISGPGSGTSDSILARISNGEYVVNAATTRRWLPFLEAINSNDGRLPAFASGGLVGPSNPSAFKSMSQNNNKDKQQQVFNINVTGDVSMQTRKEIARMIPEITSGVNMTNRERGSR